jgi:hypothetical protein
VQCDDQFIILNGILTAVPSSSVLCTLSYVSVLRSTGPLLLLHSGVALASVVARLIELKLLGLYLDRKKWSYLNFCCFIFLRGLGGYFPLYKPTDTSLSKFGNNAFII